MTRPRLLLAGYATLATVDLTATALGWRRVRRVTKPALMATLLAYVLSRRPPRGRQRTALLAALGLSLGGDAALLGSSQRSFLLGLALFLGAQVGYLATFFGRPGAPADGLLHRRRWLLLPLAGYWAGMNVVLRDGIGPMKLPVAVYSGVLLAMAAAALDLLGRVDPAAAGKITAGAGLFVASDSLIAAQAFGGLGRDGGTASEVAVMATYVVAQALIAAGAVDLGTAPQPRAA